MKLHPPNDTDYSQVWRLERVGIVPGQDFSFDAQDAALRGVLESGRTKGYAKILKKGPHLGQTTNGWELLIGAMGSYGIDYLQRAGVTYNGLGANQLDDAYYPFMEGNIGPTDDPRVLHFGKDEIPPAGAFWSVTLYDQRGFPVPNPIDRANLSSWMDLSENKDGSLDLYIQPSSPGKDKESNWLPSPKDQPWNLTMRLYAPSVDAAEGRWVPPPVNKAS
jgi:hypothetical protein